VQGKTERETSTAQYWAGDRSKSSHAGKRTLVEQIAAPVQTTSHAPSEPAPISQPRATSSSADWRVVGHSATGLPRLQLKGIPGHTACGNDGAAVQRNGEEAAGRGGTSSAVGVAPIGAAHDDGAIHRVAAAGVSGTGGRLPHLGRIQSAFGPDHDVSGINAHIGGAASEAAAQIGARAYATGNHVAFAGEPDLHTAAHEAAHVVQQRGGVHLKGGVGAAGDAYEAHADAVADRVVRGESAAELLRPYRGGETTTGRVQRAPASPDAATDVHIAAPTGGVNLPGFIDTSDGANLRTGPAEMGGKTVIDAPLPPATRVFVSGTHPSAPQWWYVTAFLPDKIVRGYVQQFRVNTDLPEPLAKLHQVKSGDTVEKLAVQEYASSVRDGHDLRYYENVLLFANKQRGRVGITGTYQDPGLLGGGANNIQGVKLGVPGPAGPLGTSTAMMAKHGGDDDAEASPGGSKATAQSSGSESPSRAQDIVAGRDNEPAGGRNLDAPQKSPTTTLARRLSAKDIARGMEIDPTTVQVFRGGKGFKLKPGEVKLDRATGLVQPTHGPSLDVVPENVARFDGAHRITHIPTELKVIQRGSRIEHFEVVPRQPMTESKFQQLLDAIEQE
jgi:Domain of unknown function (DUF4157)